MPEELFNGVNLSIGHFHIFGCKVWVHVPDQTRKALDDKARFGVLLLCLPYEKYCIMTEDD